MKKTIALLLYLALTQVPLFAMSNGDTILGEWISENKDGKIVIFKQADRYYGKITWGKTPGRKDTNNPDSRLRNRELVGSVILKEFVFKGESWENGTIYDPNSGKTYDCILKVKDNNRKLDIRGFVGMAMFGRTSTWSRN
ncbi:DUF2147 domain-containing protein [Aquirufa regiilacus]|jgi:uncharacterized protein (DUF2147 family)|uniref:DUF2147 domain-containing protein n=1 Tax=Aquirufa regiilacus TaxID=3024868 RepID=A0ABU3TU97_9BACT|nr:MULTISPECIES: DUF2147 domain-containing protein [unclassified Aquirufa]MDT8887539.1 DUF2147 domain-containing protein [Aquirufa sp. LEPPI-3A]MDU0809449.1 DUF2147 domain-containing protein [Aquirufa sp. LEOWEIH-7C]